MLRGSLLRPSGFAGQAGFSSAAGQKTTGLIEKRNSEKANIEYRMSNVEVMYSVYFKKRQRAASGS